TFLPFMIQKLKSNKKRSEKGINAFTFAQLNFRINSLTIILATVAMLVALGAGAISGGVAFKNNVMKAVDNIEVYDSVIHNPTVEERKLLGSIPFKEKSEYRYKADDEFVYYLQDDLEKTRPLIKDSEGKENIGKYKQVSGELPAGAVLKAKEDQDTDTKVMSDQWNTAFASIQPFYIHPDQTI